MALQESLQAKRSHRAILLREGGDDIWAPGIRPQNFVAPSKGSDGFTVCPPHTFLTGETEQVLTILAS
jgi:hypothetical protein